MKVAITSQAGKLASPFQKRFARCPYFLIYDTDTDQWESHKNPAIRSRGGAGPEAVQFLDQHHVTVVISGRFGPNAYAALKAAGIEAYFGKEGSTQDLMTAFQRGQLPQVSSPSGPGHHQ